MNMKFAPILLAIFLVDSVIAQEYDAFEKTIPELQAAMEDGETSSEQLVRQYLARIEAFDNRGPVLNAMTFINEDAIETARELDQERRKRGPRGPLHGIPVLLKDNYDTYDMPTTAGLVALAGFMAPDDGYQVRKLREAGAVFIGKTNMHEAARGITTISSLGGQTRNPYDPARNPGGSSGGTGAAVAANYAAVGMGSDTCGSIRIPAANNNLFGIRVTQGLSSRDGIIPLSDTQDVGGPLARSVVDLVTVLDATVGYDPADVQTAVARGHVLGSYTDFLREDGLNGKRLGLLKNNLVDDGLFGTYQEVTDIIRAAAELMVENGAETIELEIDGLDEALESSGVIRMEFLRDFDAYLAKSNAPVNSLEEILESGQYHEDLESGYRRELETEADPEEYRAMLAGREEVTRMVIAAMTEHNLDALVYPTLRARPRMIGESAYGSSCQIAAHSGLPAISLPAGFTDDGVPLGIELLAPAFEEASLISMAFAYEQAVKPRTPPARTPSLLVDDLDADFRIDVPGINGRLNLDRTTQMLHYELRVRGIRSRDIIDIKLHRGSSGENGPIIELLGADRTGSIAIRNPHLDDLLDDGLYVLVYTAQEPTGAIRGQIELR